MELPAPGTKPNRTKTLGFPGRATIRDSPCGEGGDVTVTDFMALKPVGKMMMFALCFWLLWDGFWLKLSPGPL